MISERLLGFIVVSLLIHLPLLLFAQEQIVDFTLEGKHVENSKCFATGDTMFVSYTEQADTRINRRRLVFSDGSYKVIKDSRLNNKAFLGVDTANDSLFIFFLKQRRDYITIAYLVVGDSLTTERIAHQLFEGEIILGTFSRPGERGFNIVTASKVIHQMSVLHVHGPRVIHEQTIDLPVPFFDKPIESFAFIPEGYVPSPKEAESRTKVYWSEKSVIVSEDIRANLIMKTPGKSTFVSIDLESGNHKSHLIMEPAEVNFSTYCHGGFIYKVVHHGKRFRVDVFDSLNKKINTVEINRKSSFKNDVAHHRNDLSLRVKDVPVKHVLSASGNGFISVQPSGPALSITIGIHAVHRGPEIPITLSLGIGGAILSAVLNKYVIFDDKESHDHYFYLTGTPAALAFSREVNTVQQRIDSFEKTNKFRYKSYSQTREYVIASYVPYDGSKLRIVRFNKQNKN
jgi:hypothetical protein